MIFFQRKGNAKEGKMVVVNRRLGCNDRGNPTFIRGWLGLAVAPPNLRLSSSY